MNNTLDEFDFTDDEIKEQLELLGFKNVSDAKFRNFKEDLRKLIENERSSEESQIFNQKLNEIQREKFSRTSNRSLNEYSYDDSDDDDDDDDNNKNYGDNGDYSSQIIDSPSLHDRQNPKINENIISNESYNAILKNKAIIAPKPSNNLPNPLLKRKVIRKTSNGASRTYSSLIKSKENRSNLKYLEDDNDEQNLSYLNRNFDKIQLEEEGNNFDSNNENNEDTLVENELKNESRELLSSRKFNSETDCNFENPIKSFIRSQSSLSTKFEDPSRIRKNNPVSKYHEYAKLWTKQKAPGEKNHKDLRWSIREKMLEKHIIVKKQQNCLNENKYQVPTEKKRQYLRWMVRNSLANSIK